MLSEVSVWARELEVLVTRGVRQGRLPLEELLEVYGHLAPDQHPLLHEPRQVDLEACVAALARLPEGLLHAPRVWLVPDLRPYSVTTVASPVWPAGLLPDGIMVVEVSFGLFSLLNLIAALSLLGWEANKAQLLLSGAAVETGSAEAAADDGEPTDRELSEGELSEEESGTGDSAATVETIHAHLAFIWGVDPERLTAADATAPGVLIPFLVGELALPELSPHVELGVAAQQRTSAEQGAHLVRTLAEMGLAGRPLHLWLGESVLSDCLSPYCRELRSVLLEWAGTHPEALGEDLAQFSVAANEDALYAVARDFWRSDPALLNERDEAERSVGLLRYQGAGWAFELIDLGRVDANLCDARLLGWQAPGAPAPVLIRVSPSLGDAAGELVRQIVAAVGPNLVGVTVVLPGSVLGAAAGALVSPQLMVCWAGGELVQLPGATTPNAEELRAYTDVEPRMGAVLSVPSAALLSAAHLGELVRRLGVVAVEIGGHGVIAALAEARWSGALSPTADLSWWVVHHELTRTERPDRATLGATAIIALTTLRRLSGVPEPRQPTATRREPSPTRRGVRLKA